MTSVSNKIQKRIDAINTQLNTNYVAELVQREYQPRYMQQFECLDRGDVCLGRFKIFSYAKYRHRFGKLKVYGLTWSKYFVGLRLGLSWYHIRLPKMHKRNVITAYRVDGLGIDGMSSKQTKDYLNAYIDKHHIPKCFM